MMSERKIIKDLYTEYIKLLEPYGITAAFQHCPTLRSYYSDLNTNDDSKMTLYECVHNKHRSSCFYTVSLCLLFRSRTQVVCCEVIQAFEHRSLIVYLIISCFRLIFQDIRSVWWKCQTTALDTAYSQIGAKDLLASRGRFKPQEFFALPRVQSWWDSIETSMMVCTNTGQYL